MPMHDTWQAYWGELQPKMDAYIAAHRNEHTRSALHEAFGLTAFIGEEISSKVTRYAVQHARLLPLFTQTQDLLRGILLSYEGLCLASLTVSLRTAFEVHCGLAFIAALPETASSTENTEALPGGDLLAQRIGRYADMFVRFAYIEKLRQARTSPSERISSQAEQFEREALQHAPEWFKPGGSKLHSNLHWSGPNRGIYDLAKDAGLERGYRVVYATASKFTHGSPLVGNFYRSERGYAPLAETVRCDRTAVLGADFCLLTLRVWCELFGISFPVQEWERIRYNLNVKSMGLTPEILAAAREAYEREVKGMGSGPQRGR